METFIAVFGKEESYDTKKFLVGCDWKMPVLFGHAIENC